MNDHLHHDCVVTGESLTLLFIIIIIILYSHRTVTDGLIPQAGVAITEGLTGGEKDGV